MSAARLEGWTAEEIIAELRRRERAGAAGARGATRGAAKPRAAGNGLANVSSASLAKLARQRQRAIYGVDNRKDLYEVKSAPVKAAANCVAALVKAADLTREGDGSFTLATEPYADAYQLCGSEPFVSQPIGCFCSGFLVAPDVIATAGHCVKSQASLAGMRFVFGFHMVSAQDARTSFAARDVYEGTTLIGRQLAGDGTDWALVRLDRPVAGRKPLKVRTTGKVPAAQSLFVIGHPCGLPKKYAPGAKVRDNTPGPFFVANLDTYGGNSGSPVFNAKSRTVEGILVRGENDFVSNGDCFVSLVCPTTGCRGEDVTRSTVWSSKVPKSTKAKSTAGARSKAKAGRPRRGRS